MDLHSSYDLLRIAPADLDKLSFAAAQPVAVRQWLAELPKANLGETARRLYTALQELNRLRTPPSNRQALLELIEPEVQFVCNQLQKHLRSPVVILDERRQQIAALCQTLQQQLARAAKLTASQSLALSPSDDPLCARALMLALHALYQMLCQFSLLYVPPSQGFWLELHQLFRAAARRRLQNLALQDSHGRERSIEQYYLASLLLGSARCNQLRQQAILQLGEALPAWSRHAALQGANQPGSLFAFAPATDSPPRYTSLLQEENSAQLLGLAPQALVNELRAYLKLGSLQRPSARLAVPHGIGDDLLQHLCVAWSAPAERAFSRLPGSGSLSACIGIRALHYHVAGQREFADTLQVSAAEVSADFQRHERERDPWRKAFDAAPNEALLGNRQSINYTPTGAHKEERNLHPCHQLQVSNHSPGGYCLAWNDSPPEQLQTGDLIGLQHPGERGWNIAMIRWIGQPRGSGLRLGIELLAPRAKPCGLRPLLEGNPQGQYLRCLLLNAIPALGRPAMLIAPTLPFQQGQKVLINLDGKEQAAQLIRRHALSSSFNQFEYRLIETKAPAPTQSSAGKPVTTLRLVDDNEPPVFDSLWESL